MRYFVSTGGDCRISYNLRRYLNVKSAYPFDWWYTPLAGAIKFLQFPDLDKMYDSASLVPVRQNGGVFTIRNEWFGIGLHHEFPRDEDGFVKDNYLEHIENAKQRSRYLVDKMMALNEVSNEIVFVRNRVYYDDLDDMGVYIDALLTRFDKARVLHLFVNYGVTDVAGYQNIDVEDPPYADWRGDPSVWDAAFAGTEVMGTLTR